jgi:hypothetical protein
VIIGIVSTPLPVNDYKNQLYYHPVHPHGSTGYNPGSYPTNPRLGPDPGTADYISQKPGKQHANFDPNRTPDANPTPDATRTPRPLPPVLPEDPNQEELAKAIKDMRVPDIPH